MNKKVFFRVVPQGYGKASKEVRQYISSLEEKRRYDLCFIDHLKKDKLDLQQENERLKEANKILEENWKHYMMICGKAIEYINKQNDWVKNIGYKLLKTEDLLNILQNGSDEE